MLNGRQRLAEKLLTDKNFKNPARTPIEEAIETDNYKSFKIMYEYYAEYGRLDTFEALVDQMADIRYLINLTQTAFM